MRKKLLFFLAMIVLLYVPGVFAHEKYSDGWHIVVANKEEEKDKSWDDQSKVWAYYENGKETMRYEKLIGSHRGWGEAPENSLASFKMTRQKGYYVFETDVRFTKDNVPVLSHDAKINNVARNNDLSVISEDVLVKNKTLSELKANYVFNIERVNHDSPTVLSGYDTNRITTFSEMIDYVMANKMQVSIELKEGTKEQIESLVKITQDKKAHNYVRWISFYTDLLKMVRDYDDDEILSVTKTTECDDSHNTFCGEDVDYYLQKLKTDKNIVWISGSPYKAPAISCAINLPLNKEGNEQPAPIETIPQGKVTLSNYYKYLLVGEEVKIGYGYNGDGVVKCKSSDTSSVTCSIDKTNNKVVVKSVGTSSKAVTVKLYATQGISYSATDDEVISLNVEDKSTRAKRYLDEISIDDYELDFSKDEEEYKLKIKDEDKLKINVNLENDQYTSEIKGNENLKNGSVITINILDADKEVVLSYNIKIEKPEPVGTLEPIPNTFSSASKMFTVIAIVMMISGTGIIGYNYLKSE